MNGLACLLLGVGQSIALENFFFSIALSLSATRKSDHGNASGIISHTNHSAANTRRDTQDKNNGSCRFIKRKVS